MKTFSKISWPHTWQRAVLFSALMVAGFGCRTSDTARTAPPPPEPMAAPYARPLESQAVPGTVPRSGLQVQTAAVVVSLEPGSTYFGAYDTILTGTIRDQWNLLRGNRPDPKPYGRATVAFRQSADGRVSNVVVQDNSLGDEYRSLCQDSVTSSYFRAWPADMKERIGADFRELRVTFLWQGLSTRVSDAAK